MRCACIDIGSNTTRLLVADVDGHGLEPVLADKAYTRFGRELRRTGSLPGGAAELAAEVVARQRAAAVGAGAERLRVVATAAIRGAADGAGLCERVEAVAGVRVDVLTGDDEAAFAFAGATRTHGHALPGRIAVVDVGGGSSEVAVGTLHGGVEWAASVPVGSASVLEACLHSDPPCRAEQDDAASTAAAAFAGLDVPPVDHAVAVGGSATSTAQMVGPLIDAASVHRALATLDRAPAEAVAAAHGLDVERVRLLPGGLHLLAAAAHRLGRPLEVGRGGLREGVCFDLAVG